MPNSQPPFLLLDSRLGWFTASRENIAIGSRTGLHLDSDRANGKEIGPLSLTSPDGSLGGVTLPQGMAFDDGGCLYLVSPAEARIKRYDPDRRGFTLLPSIGPRLDPSTRAPVTDGRTLTHPIGLAIAGRKLYVDDDVERRVQVFALEPPYPLIYRWGPWDRQGRPVRPDDEGAWHPVDVAAHGETAYVLDAEGRQPGRVYRQSPGLDRLELFISNLDAQARWTRVAVDRNGNVYLLDAQGQRVVRYDSNGRRLDESRDSGDIRDNFDPPIIRLRYRTSTEDPWSGRFCLPESLVWCNRAPGPIATPPPDAPSSLCLPAAQQPEETAYRFDISDFDDTGKLAARLRKPCEVVSNYLRSRFADATLKLLDAWRPGLPVDTKLEGALLDELNQLVVGASLYDTNRFTGVTIPDSTLALVNSQPSGSSIARLNRLLLEAAYPLELRRCPAATPGGLIFDRTGNPASVAPDEALGPYLYSRDGVWISQFLDSSIYRCQWHRIELELAKVLPPGSEIKVSTFSSDEPTGEPVWVESGSLIGEIQRGAPASESGPQDLLVQSRQGRYLAIMIQLHGDGYSTPEVRALRVHFPRESYLDYLPAIYSSDDQSRWFMERFLSIFQTEWDALEEQIEDTTALFDPAAVPAPFLDKLAAWLALPLEGTWSAEQKRILLEIVPRLYQIRGTPAGLQLYLQAYLQNMTGVSIESQRDYPLLVEGFRERQRVILRDENGSHLDRRALMWGPAQVGRLQLDVFATAGEVKLVSTGDPQRDLFQEYAHRFRVYVPSAWVQTAQVERMLRRAIEAEKPVQTDYDLCLVEPRFQVGVQSTVGINTIMGEYPVARLACTQQVDEAAPSSAPRSRLGYDTVLAGTPRPSGIVYRI